MAVHVMPSRSTSMVTGERSRSHFIGVRMLGASLASSSAVNGRQSATRWPWWMKLTLTSAWSAGSAW